MTSKTNHKNLTAFYLMMGSVLFLMAFFVFFSVAQAQEVLEGKPAVEETQPVQDISEVDEYEARLKLAQDMHDIWPIRTRVESALENISQQIPQQERLSFKSAMRKAIEFDSLETTSIEAMAEVFSKAELEAMIVFYGSKEGRSVSHKITDYERALQPILVKMIDKALLDTKLGAP